jgi:hypothetical protein
MFKNINSEQTTQGGTFSNIEELFLMLPARTASHNAALVTLNVPQPYVQGGVSNGISYQLAVEDTPLVFGAWSNQQSQDGRSPFTMQTVVPLTGQEQFLQALWAAGGGSRAHLGGNASLAAIFVEV